MDAVLGLDTSCYTTSAAAVDAQGKVIAFPACCSPWRRASAAFAKARPFLRM